MFSNITRIFSLPLKRKIIIAAPGNLQANNTVINLSVCDSLV